MTVALADIEQRILLLRTAQRAYQDEVRNAEELEIAAMAAEQQAIAAQATARRLAVEARQAVRDHAEEIDRLVGEWTALVPEQRRPT